MPDNKCHLIVAASVAACAAVYEAVATAARTPYHTISKFAPETYLHYSSTRSQKSGSHFGANETNSVQCSTPYRRSAIRIFRTISVE